MIRHRELGTAILCLTCWMSLAAIGHSQELWGTDVITDQNELHNNSWPHLAVNPRQPNHIVLWATNPGPGPQKLFHSTDGGASFTLKGSLGAVVSQSGAEGVTLDFTRSGILWAAFRLGNTTTLLNWTEPATLSGKRLVPLAMQHWKRWDLAAETDLGGIGADWFRVINHGPTGESPAEVAWSDDANKTSVNVDYTQLSKRKIEGANPDGDPVVVDMVGWPHMFGLMAYYHPFKKHVSGAVEAAVVVDSIRGGLTYDMLDQDKDLGIRYFPSVFLSPSVTFGSEPVDGDIDIAINPIDPLRPFVVFGQMVNQTYTLKLYGLEVVTPHLVGSVDHGTNPSLAVNSDGALAFLYQQHVSGTPNRIKTVLRVYQPDASSPQGYVVDEHPLFEEDELLPSTSLAEGPPERRRTHLVSVGKNFYGVFSASIAQSSDFDPNIIDVQRPRTDPFSSLDPIFFKLELQALPHDFYVAAWNRSKEDRDFGFEPTWNDHKSSDVWVLAGQPALGPLVLNPDVPVPESPIPGQTNTVLVRVRRNVRAGSGAGKTHVTVHVEHAKLGAGNNYTLLAAPQTVQFGGNRKMRTVDFPWTIQPGDSGSVCLVALIYSQHDPVRKPPPSIPNAPPELMHQLFLAHDNNNAMCNVTIVPSPGSGEGMGGPSSGLSSEGESLYATIHNPTVTTVPVVLELRPAGGPLPPYDLDVIGGPAEILANRVLLPDMRPGENRYLEIRALTGDDRPTRPLRLDFMADIGGQDFPGFTVMVERCPFRECLGKILPDHIHYFERMHVAFEVKQGSEEAAAAREWLAGGENRTEADYLRFVLGRLDGLRQAVEQLVEHGGDDPFGMREAVADLARAADAGSATRALRSHGNLVRRLDICLTMLQQRQGDLADRLQNVRWQHHLFSATEAGARLSGASEIASISDEFLAAVLAGHRPVDDYPQLIRQLLGSFQAVTKALADRLPEGDALVRHIEDNLGDQTRLQAAHRTLLLGLEDLLAR